MRNDLSCLELSGGVAPPNMRMLLTRLRVRWLSAARWTSAAPQVMRGRSPLTSWVDKFPDNHQFSCMNQPIMNKFILSPKNFLEANLKSILSMALVLAFCGLAGAQVEKADPIGTWKCEYKIGDQQRTSTLTITKDGDKLAGTMSWPDQKETQLKDVKLKDGELTFSAVRVLGDNKFDVEYKFTITEDKLKGKGAVDSGGEKRPFDIEGTREKKDK